MDAVVDHQTKKLLATVTVIELQNYKLHHVRQL